MKRVLLGVLLAMFMALLGGCVIYDRYDDGRYYRPYHPYPYAYRYYGPYPYRYYGGYRYGPRFQD